MTRGTYLEYLPLGDIPQRNYADTGIPVRREINEWLRGTDGFDAVFDVARVPASLTEA
ncbi:hypothetical protein [Nocardia sp. NPDC051570]|uniref:hypothetical protein n=1 Tax=Nocardia sp. NPDC051570 TaxID=3364324 RepID=UPI00378B62A9